MVVWKLVNTKVKFNHDKNLHMKKKKKRYKISKIIITVLIHQHKLIMSKITKNKNGKTKTKNTQECPKQRKGQQIS